MNIEAIASAVVSQCIAKADIAELAEKMKPAVTKIIEQEVTKAVREMDWFNIVADCIQTDEVSGMVAKQIKKAVAGAFAK